MAMFYPSGYTNDNNGNYVTVSPNSEEGVGSFGRFAQRGFLVAGFKKLIDTNQGIRDTDTVVFNLIACQDIQKQFKI